MNIIARFGMFLRDLGAAIADAAGAPESHSPDIPATPARVRIGIPDDRPMFVPVATFRNREAAQEFSDLLKEREIDSEIGRSVSAHFEVGVAPEFDEPALVYLQDLYDVPEEFPENARCPSCDLRIVEDIAMPGIRWRCLRCGQLWQ